MRSDYEVLLELAVREKEDEMRNTIIENGELEEMVGTPPQSYCVAVLLLLRKVIVLLFSSAKLLCCSTPPHRVDVFSPPGGAG